MDTNTSLQVMPAEDFGPGGATLTVARPAETVLKEAQMVVGPWAKRVRALAIFKKIGPSEHLYIEAWQMLGAMYRVTARVRETRYVDLGEVVGWECTAEAFHMPSGQVISTADGMCLNDEENWSPRPKYKYTKNPDTQKDEKELIGYVNTPLQQLRSMAQTRAMSKVYSNLFKWVAKLEGFSGTPAEEVENQPGGATTADPKRQTKSADNATTPAGATNASAGDFISEAQMKRMYAIALGEAKLSKEEYVQFLKQRGFDSSRDVTKDKYDGIIGALQELGRRQ